MKAKIIERASYKKENLNYGCLGNGLTVWDNTREKNGDYLTVAHIDTYRQISWYECTISKEQKEYVEHIARTYDGTGSVTGTCKLMRTPPQGE